MNHDLVGRIHQLRVLRQTKLGWVLDGGSEEILLPVSQVQSGEVVEETVSAFIYTDSEDRVVATLRQPLGQVGEFSCLKVVDQTPQGSFLDWGLDKDLFCPLNEQHSPLKVGQSYVFAIYLDNFTGRVAAASRLSQFFDYDLSNLRVDQEVDLLVFGVNDRGAQVIVGDRYCGLVYHDRNFKNFAVGQRLSGYVDQIRSDNKLDIRLRQEAHLEGATKLKDARSVILATLRDNGGSIAVGDKSPPEEIYAVLGLSKKAFKAGVGQLYKQGLVEPSDFETRQTIQTDKN